MVDETPWGLPRDEEQRPEPHLDITEENGANYYHRLTQGSLEWLELRRGILTASEVNRILTPTLKVANNKETRTHIYDLMAQRISGRVPDQYVSFDMERGKLEEVEAKIQYEKHYDRVAECGFVVNESLGFKFGFSPDGLVGDNGFIECKSRMPKYQVQTVIEHLVDPEADPIPPEYMLQVQSGLFATGREWCDFVSYSNGLNIVVVRVYPDDKIQAAIKEAATKAEEKIGQLIEQYEAAASDPSSRIHPVPFVDHSQEIAL